MSRPRSFAQSRFLRPPGACEILLLRHGESAAYVDGEPFALVGGHGDPALSDEGRDQAERAAQRLAESGEHISAIYVTTLRRTHETAAPLAARLGLTPAVEPDLREVFLGEWEGGEFRRRVTDADPIALRMFQEQRWDVIPGAEPDADFDARVRRGISTIATSHPDQLVVAVVHGGVIGQVMSIASGASGFTFSGADNASITHVVVTPERWIVRCYNDTSHLSPTFSSAGPPP